MSKKCKICQKKNLDDTEYSLHHVAHLRDPELDQGQQSKGQVVAMHAWCAHPGTVAQLFESRVLGHEPELPVPLLIRHLLGSMPHPGQAVADAPVSHVTPIYQIQHVRRRMALLEILVESGFRVSFRAGQVRNLQAPRLCLVSVIQWTPSLLTENSNTGKSWVL